MSDASAIRGHEMLSDLAERAYALACKVQEQAMAAEEPEAVSRLTGDFDRAARCVRQVIGLKARLARDAERQDRDDQAQAAREARGEVETRRAQVAVTVRRVIGEQYSGYDARELRDELEAQLDEEALFGGFTEEAVETHIERVCDELGLAKPGEAPPPRGPPMDPARQARIDELLSRIPDETDEAQDDEEEAAIADDTQDDAPETAGPDDTEDGEVEAASAPFDPDPEPEPAPGPPDPEPDPDPDPDPEPWPKPYVPPWELNPHARYPGGSGW